jgi:[ribosomal protein S5]-alanine N-acetyltransferase
MGSLERHEILTARLRLRPFRPKDAPAVAELCAAREIAATTLHIPHPYAREDAERWIASHGPSRRRGKSLDFAMTLRVGEEMIGAVSLRIEPDHDRAELGYWIGKPFWNQGYATEGARAAVAFGFRTLRLHRIYAHHMASNPASGEVLLKLGMRYEGRIRQHLKKWGRYEDLLLYGLLRGDWDVGPEND